MLELFYSTAMRRSELIQLDVYDVDLEERLVKIRHGKGRKPRNVPLGKRATRWLKKYLADVRPMLVERTNYSRTKTRTHPRRWRRSYTKSRTIVF
ncbi:MAG: tyrosine-type recombinase/integrase [Planctomycetales bacterium]|nr:tyrosine-type recombinase/integrase [Planctomycetales bacterium]